MDGWTLRWIEEDMIWALYAPLGVCVMRFSSLEQAELFMDVNGIVK